MVALRLGEGWGWGRACQKPYVVAHVYRLDHFTYLGHPHIVGLGFAWNGGHVDHGGMRGSVCGAHSSGS